jgi:hydroxymethylpyrimidine/phosphomethylpyrimidine kinase
VQAGGCRSLSTSAPTPKALSIAGSDSSGGAGIQADLKAFARCGVHGMTAITAITVQSTVGVTAVHMVPPEIVLAQVRTVVADIGVDAVKVGMLGTVELILAVARALDELPPGTPVVVDPVMVAESGARLLQEDAQRALVAEILPRATVLTPNLPEAHALAGGGVGEVPEGVDVAPEGVGGAPEGVGGAPEGAGGTPESVDAAQAGLAGEDAEARRLARAVLALGPRIVVLTGGHRARAVDLFVSREGDAAVGVETPGERHLDGAVAEVLGERHRDGAVVEIPGERYPDGAAHGSGCTHSSVLAAQLALGRSPLEAARVARRLAGEAVAHGLRDLGAGAGPVDILDLKRRRSGIIEGR